MPPSRHRRRHAAILAAAVTLLIAGLGTPTVRAATSGATTSKARPGPTCGGHRSVTTSGAQWICSFDDEFNASTHDAHRLDRKKWVPQRTANSDFTTGPIGHEACYVDRPNVVRVGGGVLHLSVRRQANAFYCRPLIFTHYIAGSVSTYHRFSQTYGRFAVRAKLPSAVIRGLQETFWLYPVNPQRYGSGPDEPSGEIDFAEFYSEYANLAIPYLHYSHDRPLVPNGSNLNKVTAMCHIKRGAYNTYVLKWAPSSLTMTYNGKVCLHDRYYATEQGARPFNWPFIVALTQALGINTNRFIASKTPLPATTDIDYVRIWRRAG